MKFQAAVLHEYGTPLAIEEIQTVDPKPGDVLIRLHASGLCHTDLEVIQGSLAYPLPIVLGHEGGRCRRSGGRWRLPRFPWQPCDLLLEP